MATTTTDASVTNSPNPPRYTDPTTKPTVAYTMVPNRVLVEAVAAMERADVVLSNFCGDKVPPNGPTRTFLATSKQALVEALSSTS